MEFEGGGTLKVRGYVLVPLFGRNETLTRVSAPARRCSNIPGVATGAPSPSLTVLQAPVFHGYAFSVNVQFGTRADVQQVVALLTGEHIALVHAPDEAPSNVSTAGQSDLLVSVSVDSSDENSVWIWAACDNLRVAAVTAVECAEEAGME